MSISIAERMAMQARSAARTHQAPITTASKAQSMSAAARMARQSNVASTDTKKVAVPVDTQAKTVTISAAQRIARQGNVARNDKARQASLPPPPDVKVESTMSVAERIQKQALVASAQKSGTGKPEVNKAMLDKLKSEYQEYVKKLMAELDAAGPLFFVPKAEPLKSEPAVEEKVNGISTAEGEMVIEARPSEPVPGMPYQATPVIETAKPARRARK